MIEMRWVNSFKGSVEIKVLQYRCKETYYITRGNLREQNNMGSQEWKNRELK